MKSDYSRVTFDPRKHFSSVRTQQGRVQLDADSNEEIDIINHRIETESYDVIGLCGAPLHHPAFHIVAALSELSAEEKALPENNQLPAGFNVPDFLISAGRYYVDGILCENEILTSYLKQPDLPEAKAIKEPGWYLVYVDVWRRLLTTLDDASIREIALGGPDTTTREKTVWQIKYWAAGSNPVNCGTQFDEFKKLIAPSDGRMSARSKPSGTSSDPCIVPPGAGYTGLENQFYRIEIHDGGAALDVTAGGAGTLATRVPKKNNQIEVTGTWNKGQAIEIYSNKAGDDPMNGTLAYITDPPVVDGAKKTLTLDIDVSKITLDELRVRPIKATFKWSRDNGSVVTSILGIKGNEVTVHDLGRDEVLGFNIGQLVEVSDDRLELNGLPGQLAQITDIDSALNLITLNVAPALVVDSKFHPKLRRWDGVGAVKFHPNNAVDHFLDLESGVQVRFFTGTFKTGDFWNFPARTATADTQSGNIEWPTKSNQPVAQLPFGIKHDYCRLAILHWNGTVFDVIHDCRNLFPPITELTSLFYLSGENQEAMPDPTQPNALLQLTQPLIVGVANGTVPVPNAEVRFHVTTGNGQIVPIGAPGTFKQLDAKTLDVLTDQNGLARCTWQIDSVTQVQQLKATMQAVTDLNDTADKPVHLPVTFTANLSVASQVAYNPGDCKPFAEDRNVQKALDRLSHLISLYEVSGNNQEIMPGGPLPQPLVVLAANRCGPITDKKTHVQFTVISGGGTVTPLDGGVTDATGHASCTWQPGPTEINQEVEASLVADPARPDTPPSTVRFTCTLSTAKNVFYDPEKCPALKADKVSNVQDAIDHLCEAHQGGCCDVTVGKGGQFERLDEAIKKLIEQKQGDICICLLPGDHPLPDELIVAGNGKERVKIVGCGRGTRLIFPPDVEGSIFNAKGLTSFILRDVEVSGNNLRIEVRDCDEITFAGCYLNQENQTGPFIVLGGRDSIRFQQNIVDAWLPIGRVRVPPAVTFEGIPVAADLFKFSRAEFDQKSADVATDLAGQSAAKRRSMAAQVQQRTVGNPELSTLEVKSYQNFARTLTADQVDPRALQASLNAVRAASFRAAPGVALVVTDAEANTWLEDNDIHGVVSFYGTPGDQKLTDANMKNIGTAFDQQNLEFVESQSQLNVARNNFYRFDISANLMSKLKSVAPGVKTSLSRLFRRSFISDNEFGGGNNNFVMEHAAFTANSFEREGSADAGIVVASRSIYVGNFAPDDIRLFNLFSATQKAANLLINIVDI